jgi:hypothetical protein
VREREVEIFAEINFITSAHVIIALLRKEVAERAVSGVLVDSVEKTEIKKEKKKKKKKKKSRASSFFCIFPRSLLIS